MSIDVRCRYNLLSRVGSIQPPNPAKYGLLNCPLHSEESKTAVRDGYLDFAVFGDSEAFVHQACTTGSWTGAGLCVQNGDTVSEFDPVQHVDWTLVVPPA